MGKLPMAVHINGEKEIIGIATSHCSNDYFGKKFIKVIILTLFMNAFLFDTTT